jgi:hypothetical protein
MLIDISGRLKLTVDNLMSNDSVEVVPIAYASLGQQCHSCQQSRQSGTHTSAILADIGGFICSEVLYV